VTRDWQAIGGVAHLRFVPSHREDPMSEAYRQWLKHAPPPNGLKTDQKYNVFLSYRSVNRKWVINLYDVLRCQGHQVFLDQVVIAGGDPLVRKLEDGLDQSQAGVLVWSTASADSEWVRREYEVMEAKADSGFHFVPIRLDDKPLPPFAKRRVFLDFSQYPDGPNGGDLLRLLHAVVGLPLSETALRVAEEQDEAAKTFTAMIKASVRNGDAAQLKQLFDANGLAWETPALGSAVAQGLIDLGKPEAAIEILDALERRFARAIRPKQLRALALTRRNKPGDLEAAQTILGTLYELGERDPETLGIYGSTWMKRYERSGNAMDLRQSRDYYAEAFEAAPDDFYTGINAAAKSILLGTPDELQRGRELADRVEQIVGTKAVANNYWKSATVAEVQLLKSNFKAAGDLYAAAVAMARSEHDSHKSTWQQARLLMAALGPDAPDRELIRQAFAHLPDAALPG
jgi:tetratricopeptide (TPR) repeat protein